MEGDYGISRESLYFSIGFALLHLLFEIWIIFLDSQASQSSFFRYAIECLWARLEWVPFVDSFEKILEKQIDTIEQKEEIAQRAIEAKNSGNNNDTDDNHFKGNIEVKYKSEHISTGNFNVEFKDDDSELTMTEEIGPKTPLNIKNAANIEEEKKQIANKTFVVNFEEMNKKLLCFDYRIEFVFSNQSIKRLSEYFIYLPSPTNFFT